MKDSGISDHLGALSGTINNKITQIENPMNGKLFEISVNFMLTKIFTVTAVNKIKITIKILDQSILASEILT